MSKIKNIILILSISIFSFIIGHVSGLYFGFPNTITLDYGDNMLKVTENLKEISNNSININKEMYKADACTHGCVKGNPTRTIINCAEYCSNYYLNMTVNEWINSGRD